MMLLSEGIGTITRGVDSRNPIGWVNDEERRKTIWSARSIAAASRNAKFGNFSDRAFDGRRGRIDDGTVERTREEAINDP
ncbi:hypothetical protein HZH66_001632 [Vespula vulgaris]|uniref:Uncharacterized protein n=1 Tax=Vespula vulgaris TaxID=7454 RepID=A0A834KVH9_VESVU|nr:hypothetical protein HZH66_001632 [Vespula vulgaris]